MAAGTAAEERHLVFRRGTVVLYGDVIGHFLAGGDGIVQAGDGHGQARRRQDRFFVGRRLPWQGESRRAGRRLGLAAGRRHPGQPTFFLVQDPPAAKNLDCMAQAAGLGNPERHRQRHVAAWRQVRQRPLDHLFLDLMLQPGIEAVLDGQAGGRRLAAIGHNDLEGHVAADGGLGGAVDLHVHVQHRRQDGGGDAIVGLQAAGRRYFGAVGDAAVLDRPERQLHCLPLPRRQLRQPPLEPLADDFGRRRAAQISEVFRHFIG